MGVSDLRGEICICLPLRPIIAILAGISMIIGGWHIFQIFLGLMDSDEWDAASDYASSCQGRACHAAFRDHVISCQANRNTTFKLRYLLVGIFGLCFGYLGLQGTMARNSIMVKSFAWYLLLLAIAASMICGADNVYILVCSKLSLNMQRDIGAWIPWETMGLLHAQGHKDLSAFTANKLKDILGYDFLPFIFFCYATVILITLYFSWSAFQLASSIELGPVGLGSNFLINNTAAREINQMKDRLYECATEQINPVRNYEALAQLRDADQFPYFTVHGSSPAMQYGTIGAARPLPLPKESA